MIGGPSLGNIDSLRSVHQHRQPDYKIGWTCSTYRGNWLKISVGIPRTKGSLGKNTHTERMILKWIWDKGWKIVVLWFDSRRGLGIFLFTTASRTALGPTQPPIQWVRGALFLGIKRPGREADNSPPSSAEVKECVQLYLHSPNTPSWRGA
jgi:hypothetical protein